MKLKGIMCIALALLLVSMLSGASNVLIVKAASSGSSQPPRTEWNKTYGGASWDYAFSVVQTSEGGYAMAGGTDSFGAGGDFWLIKLAPEVVIVTVLGETILIEGNVTITDATATTVPAGYINTLSFNAFGPTNATGYINTTIPRDIVANPKAITVFIDDKPVPKPEIEITSNSTHYFIYFKFKLSTHTITIQFGPAVGGNIVPLNKFALLVPWIVLAVSVMVATVSVAVYRKKYRSF